MEYTVFNTKMGWMVIVGSKRGLIRTSPPHSSAQEALDSLGDIVKYATLSLNAFNDLVERLRAYFNDCNVLFPDKLDFSAASRFQEKVWQAARLIPYGETRSYGWLAGKIGKPGAARAVGQALGKNRLPIIIPCHRIIGSDGSLGGFNGGIELKKRLLKLEVSATSPQR